jgi:Tfp pilus assembly protein PilE
LGLVLLLIGVPIYVKYSPKKEIAELKEELLSREAVIRRAYTQEERFLANALRHIKRWYRKRTGKKQTWVKTEEQ